jgi:hypothetical protein
MPDELSDEVKRAGGPFEWAKTRREYADLKLRPASVGTKSKLIAEPKKQKVPQALRIPEIRYDYIRSVLIAEQKGAVVPNAPKVLREELAPFDGNNNRIIEWAKGQVEAQQIMVSLPTAKSVQPLAQSSFERAKASYLSSVIAAMMRRETHPQPPRKWQAELEPEITLAGGIPNWARKQPEYESLAARALAKATRQSGVARVQKPVSQVVFATTDTRPQTRTTRKALQPSEANSLKREVLLELNRTHPGASTAAIINAEIAAESMLQEHAKALFQTAGRPKLQVFPAYLALMNEIRIVLRQRRR